MDAQASPLSHDGVANATTIGPTAPRGDSLLGRTPAEGAATTPEAGGTSQTRDPRASPDVLIVQEDPMFADMLEYALQARGHDARAVQDLAEAHEAIEALAGEGDREPRTRVVVLDPAARGLESVDLIRRFGRFGSGALHFVALSSDSSESAQILAFESGVADYVVKPAHLPVLLARIDCVLRSGSS